MGENNTSVMALPENIGTTQSDWQSRHVEAELRRDAIRDRIRSQVEYYKEKAKVYFRPAKPKPSIQDTDFKRVAVYTRVSTCAEEQTSSIENQTLFYTKKIEETENWTLEKIYSDEGKSGTSLRKRTAFQQMMVDAKHKKIDLVICASVSRFARNFSDCITQISELKTMNPSHPIGVYFETENIYTLDPDSEKNLELQALLADWESGNKSRRMILSYDQRIMTGQYPVADLMGFRHTRDGRLEVVEEEAKTIRFIFLAYIQGYDCSEIAGILTKKKRPTMRGRVNWNESMVSNIMRNERRWGDLEARKNIVVDYKRGKVTRNNGTRCSAYVPEHHKAIVSPEIARAVQMISGNTHLGVQEITVINKGSLKGFVSAAPSWNGVNAEIIQQICLSAYDEAEKKAIEEEVVARSGQEPDKAEYQTVPGVCFLNRACSFMTISQNYFVFNKTCYEYLDDCEYVELLFHPILKMIVLRVSDENSPTAFRWKNENHLIMKFHSGEFAKAVFEAMHWSGQYKVRCRGIRRGSENARCLIFTLDHPKILNSNRKTNLEEMNNKMGVGVVNRRRRMLNSINDVDIMEAGTAVENPLIGTLPSREEVRQELDRLLKSM